MLQMSNSVDTSRFGSSPSRGDWIGLRKQNAIVVEDVVFRKTVAGHNEVEHRHVLRRAELRRLLILIDGHRAIDEFVQYFRYAELPKLIDELLGLGLIESAVSGASFTGGAVAEVLGDGSSMGLAQFESARRAAMHAASELLGATARPFCKQIVDCTHSGELRKVLDDVGAKMKEVLGSDAVTLFMETVRDAARVREM
jgi:hypothetical protein